MGQLDPIVEILRDKFEKAIKESLQPEDMETLKSVFELLREIKVSPHERHADTHSLFVDDNPIKNGLEQYLSSHNDKPYHTWDDLQPFVPHGISNQMLSRLVNKIVTIKRVHLRLGKGGTVRGFKIVK